MKLPYGFHVPVAPSVASLSCPRLSFCCLSPILLGAFFCFAYGGFLICIVLVQILNILFGFCSLSLLLPTLTSLRSLESIIYPTINMCRNVTSRL